MVHILQLYETNYCYIVGSSSDVMIVDPGESAPVLSFIKEHNLRIKSILLTHSHKDHSGGVRGIVDVYPNIEIFDYTSDTSNISVEFEILKTPGHSLDSCCFYFPNLESIFSGDTLFTGLCGKLLGGTYKDLYSSLILIKGIPPETKVYPGHEYLSYSIDFLEDIGGDTSFYNNMNSMEFPSTNSTIGDEIRHNPFLTTDYKRFVELRKLKG